MSLSKFVTLICSAAMAATSVVAQTDSVAIDLSTGALQGARVRAGANNTVVVTGLNPFCYSYAIRVTPNRAAFDVGAAKQLFSSEGSPPRDTPVNPLIMVDPANPPFSSAEVRGAPDSARALVAAAAEAISDAARTLYVAADVVAKLQQARDCKTPSDARLLMTIWARDGQALQRQLAGVRPSLRGAIEILTSATLEATTLSREIERLAETAVSLTQAHDILRPQFTTAASHLDAAAQHASMSHEFATERDHESVAITVTRTASETSKSDETTFAIATVRRYRISFSTGVVGSGISSTHYERVNRQAFGAPSSGDTASAPLDSTYSTWAQVSGSGRDLLSPALIVSASFARSGADLSVIAGTALRGVNGGNASLEPMLGFGVGLLDRAFVIAGVHYGRQEKLLLTRPGESAGNVANRAIPTAVTRNDAVGTEWKLEPFVGFSLVLN